MPSLVLGFGCERGIRSEAVIAGIRDFFDGLESRFEDVGGIVSIDLKDDEKGLLEAADELGVDLTFYDVEQLRTVDPPNPNPVVRRAVGVDGVAETAALVASSDGTLLEEKTVLRPEQRGMTLALAR